MPKLIGEGFYLCTIRVEYEWKPPRCSSCKVFDHVLDECLKKIVSDVVKNLKSPIQAARGVQVSPKVGFKPTKKAYILVSNKNIVNISSTKKQVGLSRQEVSNSNPFDALNSVENDDDLGTNGRNSKSAGKGSLNVEPGSSINTPIVEKIDKLEKQIIDVELIFVDDDGKPLDKVGHMVNADSNSEVEEVPKEILDFMASISLQSGSDSGYSTKSLLELWRETKPDDDYDPYDDDLYDGYNMSINLQAICDDLDIKVHGGKKK
nr:hypothetical protein [Tanacetum cinerariifolium]